MSVLAERLSDGEIAHMPTCAVATFTWDEDDWESGCVEPGLDFDTRAEPWPELRIRSLHVSCGQLAQS